jgi:hypothetical protein
MGSVGNLTADAWDEVELIQRMSCSILMNQNLVEEVLVVSDLDAFRLFGLESTPLTRLVSLLARQLSRTGRVKTHG